MNIRISRAALDAILLESNKAIGQECCGLLQSGTEKAETFVEAILPAANVAADRRTRFEIDPATLIRAHRAEREGGPRILGCYHSHPGGNSSPSAEDAAQAEPNGWLWLICGGSGDVTLWRAVVDGAVHGRFDPVEIIVEERP